MIKEYYKLLGVDFDASINDIKKVYRNLVKEYHPDRFTDEIEKQINEKKMTLINEAYKYIKTHYKEIKLPLLKNEKRSETDYDVYKKGFACYANYCRASRTEEKIKNLKKAQEYFIRLIKEFPKSEWVYDSKVKLRNIGSIVETSKDFHFEYGQKRNL